MGLYFSERPMIEESFFIFLIHYIIFDLKLKFYTGSIRIPTEVWSNCICDILTGLFGTGSNNSHKKNHSRGIIAGTLMAMVCCQLSQLILTKYIKSLFLVVYTTAAELERYQLISRCSFKLSDVIADVLVHHQPPSPA